MSWASERTLLGAALLAAGLLLAACGDDAGSASDEGATLDAPRVEVPTSDWRSGDPGGRALLEGRLDLSDAACPVVVPDDEAGGTLVVWPAGTYAAEETSRPGLYTEDDVLLAADGSRVRLSGSFTTDVNTDCEAPREVFLVEADVQVVER